MPHPGVLVVDNGGKDWKHYDWSKITTIIALQNVDSELLCHAHEKGVRIVMKDVMLQMYSQDRLLRNLWITSMVHSTQKYFLDGINLEFSHQMKNFEGLSALVAEVTETFQRMIPGSQISVTLPWTPDCRAFNCNDFAAVAKSCDFFVVQSFAIHLQMWRDCFAKANAPYHQALSGLSAYIRLGVDPKKLVMGIPWFGRDYTCLDFYEPGRCEITKKPFKGAPCSSQVAKQIPYKEVMEQLPKSFTGRYWDDSYKSPYYVYKDGSSYHEVWYDDPESLSLKATIMKKLKLRGISAWFGNSLNHSFNPIAAMQTEGMWNALCPIRRKWRV
ncbi:di-N-acetylchitobiase-like isoform X2 [Scyliorhinus canicula]|uniref:di-N-acetylchitobiase-like isoform X2 n=1 Tax=Scyliorhinus canicula TaxID=7830 RepID=UPI0018F4B5E7|nr:di-N-acetylchitobiase-like isoform X2 [Scyliorhinus canicula]